MKASVNKTFGISGVKVELTLSDLYVLKHTIDRISKVEEWENEYQESQSPTLYGAIRSETAEIISNLKIFLGKITKDIQSPEDSDIFTPEKDCEDEITL